MSRRALIALGIGQCVNWGVLYYAFAVLLTPLEQELQMPAWVVTGAFSLALFMSAVVAPHAGAWCDAGRGSAVMQIGGFSAALLLVLWALVPGLVTLYVVWAGLGLCMAATLYEPAFVIVGRSFSDPKQRLRSLAVVTLFGGLASSVFLPLTALLVAQAGWRHAVLGLGALLLVSTAITRKLVFHDEGVLRGAVALNPRPPEPDRVISAPPRFILVSALFALATLAGSGYSANLIAALAERGISQGSAAGVGGLIGVMQLPGRALLMHGAVGGAPSALLTLSLALHGAGLLGVAFAPSMWVAAIATAVFAAGAGLTTLVRPHLVHDMAGVAQGGYVNGRIARHQQLARAAGPLLVAWLATLASYTVVIATIAAVFMVGAVAWQRGSSPNSTE